MTTPAGKRQLQLETITPPKKMRENNAGPMGWTAKIFPMAETDNCLSNKVWIHIENLPAISATRHYVQIGQRVYQVATTTKIGKYQIGLSPLQISDLRGIGAIEKDTLHYTFYYEPPVSTLDCTFEIILDRLYEPVYVSPRVYDLQLLKQEIHKQLSHKYISYQQPFYIRLPVGYFTAVVKNVNACEPNSVISDITRIDFVAHSAREPLKDISLVDYVVTDPEAVFHFKITVEEIHDKSCPAPYVVDLDKLEKNVKAHLNSTLILGEMKKFKIDNLIGIYVTLEKVEYKEDNPKPFDKRYDRGFNLLNENKIIFSYGKNLLGHRFNSIPAKAVEFKIISFKPHLQPESETALNWVPVDIIKKWIVNGSPRILEKQRINCPLAHGTAVLKVKKIIHHEDFFQVRQEHWKPIFHFNEKTDLAIHSTSQQHIQILDTLEPHNLLEITVRATNQSKLSVSLPTKKVEEFIKGTIGQIVVPKQKMTMGIEGKHTVELLMTNPRFNSKPRLNFLGRFTAETKIRLVSDSHSLKFIESDGVALQPLDFLQQFEEQGIGGLSPEIENVFRQVVSTRGSQRQLAREMGLTPVRGILLYGPPGTGKTTMARALASILGINKKNLVMKSGSEMHNKWLGESERAIRTLFAPAKKNFEEMGELSEQHMIVIDELGTLARKRGQEGSSARDSTVEQLLAEMDGLTQYDNLLVVGTTNNLEGVDEALKRPGRFDFILKVDLPDAKGREKILAIHTRQARIHGWLHPDLDLKKIAEKMKDASGAAIKQTAQKAFSTALERQRLSNIPLEMVKEDPKFKITTEDFENAIEKVAKEELSYFL